MGILFSAPQHEFNEIRGQWLEAVGQIAQQGVFVGGPRVSGFEKAFAGYTGVQDTIGVGNGTDAIFLALKALDIGPGDEVITVANTFVATVGAIHHTGATPVLVDCGTDYLIDLDQVKNRVTPKTKAIIPVHLYGRMVDLRSFVGWAAERRIAVVEDCAQAAGARAYGRRAGSWGVMGCHSFYPDKNLGALGDGGAITTSSPELCGKLRKLRNHGGEIRYQHELPGYNSRLDPIQACALELKLARLDSWNEHRRRAASRYQMRLGDLQGIVLPAAVSPDDESHVFHLYVIRVMDGRRDELKKHLQKKGILTAIQYPAPVHLLPAYAYLEHGREAFPLSEQYAGEILSLPMHAVLTEQEIDLISGEIRALLQA